MDFIRKYKHGLGLAGFALIYTQLFFLLEQRHLETYHLIHSPLDDLIPFCEYFIVPYLLWFPYMVLAVLYFIFWNKDTREYHRLARHLMLGMSLFLIISYVFPNGQNLRPETFVHDNLFTQMVELLYETDTPTNILPSIHVFNSLVIHMAIINCKALSQYRWVNLGSLVLTASIVLSTMFLKQHSVIDVCMATGVALLGYAYFYREPLLKKRQLRQAKRLGKTI